MKLGAKIKLIYAIKPNHKFLGMIREVVLVQTNGVYFSQPNGGKSWLDFPKAPYFVPETNGFSILEDEFNNTQIKTGKKVVCLTYEVIQ